MAVKKLQNFIGGKYQSPLSDSVSDVIDPSTEQVYAHAPVSSAADVDHAYKVAAKAFETWSQTTPSERQLALFRIKSRLRLALQLDQHAVRLPAHHQDASVLSSVGAS